MFKVDTDALEEAMAGHGIRHIEDLARRTGVNRNTLSEVLRGNHYPSSPVMQSLVHVLDLDAESAGRIFLREEPD